MFLNQRLSSVQMQHKKRLQVTFLLTISKFL